MVKFIKCDGRNRITDAWVSECGDFWIEKKDILGFWQFYLTSEHFKEPKHFCSLEESIQVASNWNNNT